MAIATQVVHWPGQDVPACDEHAVKLRKLASFMEFPVSTTPCEEGTLCANCLNEECEKPSVIND